jgi:cysteine desulfurase
MEPFLSDAFGNPSSAHAWGRRAAAALDEARARAALALGAHPGEVVFVRGGTESDNLAVLGRAAAARREGRTPLIVHTAFEHRAVLDAAEACRELGGDTRALAVDRSGALDLDALEGALDERPALVSVLWVNNEVGTVLPVREVVRRARARGVVVHSDAVQAVGKVPVDAGEEGPHLLTVTGHKIHGPKGTGLLVVRPGVKLLPLLFGGGQEGGLRPGTQDVAGAVGLATALELAVRERETEAPRLAALRDLLEAGLGERLTGIRVHGGTGERAPHVSNVGIRGIDQETLLAGLDLEGILVSGGSACASGVPRASHVLRAMYGAEADGWATVRFSLGRQTTGEEIRRAVEVTASLALRLREPRARTAPGEVLL